MDFQINATGLMVLLGSVVSLAFSWFPGLKERYSALTQDAKSGIQIGVLFLLTAAVFGLGCVGILNTGLVCSADGVVKTVIAFVLALASNQGTYQATKHLARGVHDSNG